MNHLIARILSIEDHPIVAQFIQMVLAEVGIEVTHTRTAARGWELARQQKFDLILMDGGSYDLCRRLKQDEQLKTMPVVILSGAACPDHEHDLLESGVVDFIFPQHL